MAEAEAIGSGSTPSFSMRMVIYGIKKRFPSVRNISTEQLEQWHTEKRDNLVFLVREDNYQPFIAIVTADNYLFLSGHPCSRRIQCESLVRGQTRGPRWSAFTGESGNCKQ